MSNMWTFPELAHANVNLNSPLLKRKQCRWGKRHMKRKDWPNHRQSMQNCAKICHLYYQNDTFVTTVFMLFLYKNSGLSILKFLLVKRKLQLWSIKTAKRLQKCSKITESFGQRTIKIFKNKKIVSGSCWTLLFQRNFVF